MEAQAPTQPPSQWNASRDVARGMSWAVLMRWCMRFLGMISTIVLARLLTPEDFGVAAMGTIAIGFLTRFTEFGTAQYLIRAKEIDDAHCHTAWTLDIIQGVLIAIALVALAVPATHYFREPRVEDVMYVLAVAALITGLQNIGPTLARRDLQFAVDFRFNVYKSVLVFFTTLTFAVVLRNYWALVIGYVTGTAAGVVLSYAMFPDRPRWSLTRAAEYIRFAINIFPMRVGIALQRQLALLIVGGLGNTTGIGAFSVAGNLATMFTHEIVIPMGRGLYPNFTRLANEPKRLSEIFTSVLALVTLVCIPFGVGLSSVATDVVALILGPKWSFTAELLQYLALAAIVAAIIHTLTAQILISTGRERDAAVLAWVRLGIATPILIIGASSEGMVGVAKASIVAALTNLPIMYLVTRRAVHLPVSTFVGLLWRPLLASALMYVAVRTFHLANVDVTVLRLAWDVTVGGVVFVGTTLILWLIAGRPYGAEATVLKLVSTRLRRFVQ